MGFLDSLSAIGSVAGSVGNIISSIYATNKSSQSQSEANAINKEYNDKSLALQQSTLDYQKYYDANKYSIMANDLEKNGLSKTLMTGNTGSSSTGNSSGVVGNQQGIDYSGYANAGKAGANAINSLSTAVGIMQQKKELQAKDAEIAILNEQAEGQRIKNANDTLSYMANSKYLDRERGTALSNASYQGAKLDMENKLLGLDYGNYDKSMFMKDPKTSFLYDSVMNVTGASSMKDAQSKVGSNALKGVEGIMKYLDDTASDSEARKEYARKNEISSRNDKAIERIKKANALDNASGKASADANKHGRSLTDYYKKYGY